MKFCIGNIKNLDTDIKTIEDNKKPLKNAAKTEKIDRDETNKPSEITAKDKKRILLAKISDVVKESAYGYITLVALPVNEVEATFKFLRDAIDMAFAYLEAPMPESDDDVDNIEDPLSDPRASKEEPTFTDKVLAALLVKDAKPLYELDVTDFDTVAKLWGALLIAWWQSSGKKQKQNKTKAPQSKTDAENNIDEPANNDASAPTTNIDALNTSVQALQWRGALWFGYMEALYVIVYGKSLHASVPQTDVYAAFADKFQFGQLVDPLLLPEYTIGAIGTKSLGSVKESYPSGKIAIHADSLKDVKWADCKTLFRDMPFAKYVWNKDARGNIELRRVNRSRGNWNKTQLVPFLVDSASIHPPPLHPGGAANPANYPSATAIFPSIHNLSIALRRPSPDQYTVEDQRILSVMWIDDDGFDGLNKMISDLSEGRDAAKDKFDIATEVAKGENKEPVTRDVFTRQMPEILSKLLGNDRMTMLTMPKVVRSNELSAALKAQCHLIIEGPAAPQRVVWTKYIPGMWGMPKDFETTAPPPKSLHQPQAPVAGSASGLQGPPHPPPPQPPAPTKQVGAGPRRRSETRTNHSQSANSQPDPSPSYSRVAIASGLLLITMALSVHG